MVGKFSFGKISMGILESAIMEKSNNPPNRMIVVTGLFNAAFSINNSLMYCLNEIVEPAGSNSLVKAGTVPVVYCI